MRCPLTPAHLMIEIAPGLWQCPKCGSGPKGGAHFPFWALSCVAQAGHECEGLAVHWDQRLDVYIASCLEWAVDDDDVPIAGSLSQELVEYISTAAEMENSYLPVITRGGRGSGCSSDLSRLMFDDPLGPKEI